MNPIDGATIKQFRDEIASVGYAALRGQLELCETAAVATALGEIIDPWSQGPVQSLVPQTTSTPNTYSGIFGVGRFPFHTDLAHWLLPPRYVLLRCIKGYDELPTLLADGKSLQQNITPDVLGRAIVRPRRRVLGRSGLLRLLQSQTDGEALLRWDEVFLKPASAIGELACSAVTASLAEITVTPVAMADPGDIVVIDNWRMLHSRPQIPRGLEDRHLERVYLRRLN